MGTLLPSVSSLVEELEELSPDQLGKLAAFLAQLRHSHETPTSSVADNGLSELLDSGLIDGFWQQHGDNPTARWASPGLQQRLGYRPGEIRDHSEWLIDHLDASDAAAIQIDICRLLNDPSFKSERLLRYRHQDGSPVWMRCRLLRLADKVLVAHTDVTTFKRAGERLRALYEAVPDMHVVMEISGFRILNCNQRFGEVAGFSREEIVGRPFLDLLQPEGLIQFQAATATLSQQGKCANYELLLERKDGSCLAALVSSSLGHDCETNAPYIQCWFRDIAHLKRLANYEFLLEALPQAVLLIDFEGRIRASNPVAAKTFGYSQPELLELNVLTLLPKRYRSGDGDLLRSLLERSTRRDFGASADLIGVRKSGHEFPAQTGLGRLQTFDGPLILVTIIDRTEQKRLEQDLLEHKERVRLALDSGAIGIWDFEVTTGRSVADARCKAAYGIPSDGTWSSDIGLKAVHPDDRGRLLQAIRAAYGPASDGSFHAEYRTIGVFDGVLRQV
ncbi:MAG: PAS domain S-box protein, partial [Acidobacteriaceae bacterium]|nr:PAS domain S-box protein [Acidobacteriaceae bacterium]